MRRLALTLTLIVAATGVLGGTATAGPAGPVGRVQELPIPQCAVDINDQGTILTATTIYRAGRLTAIPAGMELAGHLNNRGQIAGISLNTSVLWDGRKLVTIPFVPGDDYSWVSGLNERGDVVGGSQVVGNSEEQLHGWVWRDNRLTVLKGLSDLTLATGVNDRGQILGQSFIDYGWVPIRWERSGAVTRLDTLGGKGGNSYPVALNNRGEAVGSAFTGPGSAGEVYPVKWYANGDVKKLSGTGYFGAAGDINDRGQIVGSAQRPGPGLPVAFYRQPGQQLRLFPDATPEAANSFSAVNRAGVAVGCNASATATVATRYRPA